MSVKILEGPGQGLVDNAGHKHIMSGLHPFAGGDGTEACSGDILLQSLVACAGVTFRAVWNALNLSTINSGKITAVGEMNFCGTLGVDKDVPVGLTNITLIFDIDSDEDDKTVKKAIEMSERYCVVYQTLKDGAKTLKSGT